MQVIAVGQRLIELQTFGINKIDGLSQKLKNEWSQFRLRIDQRSNLLKLALISHQKCSSVGLTIPFLKK